MLYHVNSSLGRAVLFCVASGPKSVKLVFWTQSVEFPPNIVWFEVSHVERKFLRLRVCLHLDKCWTLIITLMEE